MLITSRHIVKAVESTAASLGKSITHRHTHTFENLMHVPLKLACGQTDIENTLKFKKGTMQQCTQLHWSGFTFYLVLKSI